MRATLQQYVSYSASDGQITGDSKTIASFEGERIQRRSQDTWNNQPFLIPQVPPTIKTYPVEVGYRIKIDVRVPWGCNPKIYLDITIGTLPFQQSFGIQCTSQVPKKESSSTLDNPNIPAPLAIPEEFDV